MHVVVRGVEVVVVPALLLERLPGGMTSFEGPHGADLTAGEFFAELAVGTVIDAEGNFFEDVLTVRHIDIED